MNERATTSTGLPLDALPVFPLPNVVLFPGQRLPLHIFEPRYRQMVRDAISGTPYIVVACIAGDPSAEPSELERVATAGRIVAHQRLADGRFNIVVEGLVRVAVSEIESEQMYRRVQCVPVGEPSGPSATLPTRERAALMGLVGLVMQLARAKSPDAELSLAPDLDDGTLVFRLADALLVDGVSRQRILSAPRLDLRAAELSNALTDLYASVTSERGSAPGAAGRA